MSRRQSDLMIKQRCQHHKINIFAVVFYRDEFAVILACFASHTLCTNVLGGFLTKGTKAQNTFCTPVLCFPFTGKNPEKKMDMCVATRGRIPDGHADPLVPSNVWHANDDVWLVFGSNDIWSVEGAKSDKGSEAFCLTCELRRGTRGLLCLLLVYGGSNVNVSGDVTPTGWKCISDALLSRKFSADTKVTARKREMITIPCKITFAGKFWAFFASHSCVRIFSCVVIFQNICGESHKRKTHFHF